MQRKHKARLADLVVKAEDCYDPTQYTLVHNDYLHGLRDAIRRSHVKDCICRYCTSPTVSGNSNG